MIVAEVYIHWRSAGSRSQQERFGHALNEYAIDAARRFLDECYLEVIVEEGSTKAKVRARRALTAALMIYGATADFDSFCRQVGVMYANTEWFLKTVALRVQYGEIPGSPDAELRIEKRHKTTGKLKQIAEAVLELNDNHHRMSAGLFRVVADELIAKLGEIQREVSEDEMRHLLKVLSLENFHGTPTKEPLDLFRSPNVLHRPRTEEEELAEIALQIAQDHDHIGESRILPIPHRIYEKHTHVRKDELVNTEIEDIEDIEARQRREPPQILEH
jgi:hypothetical protein